MASKKESTGNFKIVRASAGSGKTYSLVKEYLMLALKTKSVDYYKHILAITFTNAAAAEMKGRVIDRLRELSSSTNNNPTLLNDLVQTLGISTEEVQSRSAAVYKHILHNYSSLSIQTIDGFTHKLIRTFSHELHLNHDFSIEMNTQAFAELIADKCLDSIGHDTEITRYLELFALENIEEGSSWNVRTKLVDFSKKLFQEEVHDALEKLSNYKLEDFRKFRKLLFEKQSRFEKELKSLGEEGLKIIKESGLQVTNFSNGKNGGMMILSKLSNENFEYPKARFFELLNGGSWYAKTTAPEVRDAIDSVKNVLTNILQNVEKIFSPENYGAYRLRSLILGNIYMAGLLNVLNGLSKQLKIENNTLLISDFHLLLNEVVRDSPAPFIYERIGNRYKHILIDEFQDTSALQWANAVPLIQNSLSENNKSLLVGDAKQSIYRWRGGRAEQFVDLPKINIRSDYTEDYSFFESHFEEQILEYNYRSAKSIVEFNNQFYDLLSTSLGNKSNVYSRQAQLHVREKIGLVQINQVESPSYEERWLKSSELILSYIKQSIDEGYRPCDIAILTRRGNKDGGPIATLLSENGYEVVTQESFLLNNSSQVRAVMAYLNYLSDPQKQFAAVDCVHSLNQLNKSLPIDDFIQSYIPKKGKQHSIGLDDFLNLYFIKKQREDSSVYRTVINLMERFNLQMDIYLECLLEHIKELTILRNLPLAALVDWWSVAKMKTYVSSPQNENAIRIMTIHKSKGLQFPVVIYPRFASKDLTGDIWIQTDEQEFGLPTALVKYKSSTKNDDEILWPEEFYEETEKSRLDDLNLCYVATTRAEDRLYMLIEKGRDNTWLTNQIDTVLNQSFASEKTDEQWTFGQEETQTPKSSKENAQVITPSSTGGKHLKLRVKNIGDDFTQELLQGNLIHEVLAEINHVSSIEQSVERVAKLRNISKEQIQNLMDEVSSIVNHPDFKHWFSGKSEVLSEREIGSSDGKILRPDKVVIEEKNVSVIDFKTGLPRKEHMQQVREYINQLENIYSLPIKGYILYTQNKQLLEVGSEIDT